MSSLNTRETHRKAGATVRGRANRIRKAASTILASDEWAQLAVMRGRRDEEAVRIIHRIRLMWDRLYGTTPSDMMVGIIHQADSSHDVGRLLWALPLLAEHGTLSPDHGKRG